MLQCVAQSRTDLVSTYSFKSYIFIFFPALGPACQGRGEYCAAQSNLTYKAFFDIMLSPSKFHIRIRTNFFLNALLYIGGKAAKQNLYHISSNNFMKITTQGYITTTVSQGCIPVQLLSEEAECLRKQYWQPTYQVIKAIPLLCEYQQKMDKVQQRIMPDQIRKL